MALKGIQKAGDVGPGPVVDTLPAELGWNMLDPVVVDIDRIHWDALVVAALDFPASPIGVVGVIADERDHAVAAHNAVPAVGLP